jgi:hypothetical protein
VPCEYLPPPPIDRHSINSSGKRQNSHRSASIETQDETSTLDPDNRRLLELQLLHHFNTVVIHTIPSSDDEVTFLLYNRHFVQLAFSHPVLLNAILALSALHMLSSVEIKHPIRSLGPIKMKDHPLNGFGEVALVGSIDARNAHRIYLNLAIKQQSETIDKIFDSHTNHARNALVVATVMLSYQALGFWRLQTHDQDELSASNYAPPIHWLRMVKGIESIAQSKPANASETAFMNFMSTKNGKPDFSDKEALFGNANIGAFGDLIDYERFPEETPLNQQMETTYRLSLAYIGGIHKMIEERGSPSSLFRMVLCMGLMVPGQFLDMIEQRKPRALAIFALYCSAMLIFEDHWMFSGMAVREIKGIELTLPEEWKWAMERPRRIMEEGRYRSLFADEDGMTG